MPKKVFDKKKRVVSNKKQSPTIKKGGMFENKFFSYVDSNHNLKFTNYCIELNNGVQKYGVFKPDNSHIQLPITTPTTDPASRFSDDIIPIYNNIFKIYSPEDLAEIINIFKKFFSTRGVVSGGKLHRACLKKCGGGLLKESSLLQNLKDYCEKVSDDEEDIKKYLTGNKDKSILKEYTALADYIEQNFKRKQKMLYINCNDFYNYKDCKQVYYPTKVLKITYDCFDYNEDIVSSFESANFEGVEDTDLNDTQIQKYKQRNIYSNNVAINLFIQEQLEYLKSLHLYEKRIIQDYTRINTTFHFYESFKNKKSDYESFRYFSDGFFTQIYKLYNEDHELKLNELYYKNLEIEDNQYNWFRHWLKHDRVEDIRDKDYGVAPAVYQHATKTPFANADFINWGDVLTKFINDVTYLIVNAPVVKQTIYGYRGVSGHYIHENQSETEKSKQIEEIKKIITTINSDKQAQADNLLNHVLDADNFINFRLSSITFDFNISKFFHDKYKNEYSAIYKSSIKQGCKVLLISPLSMFYQEFEIITPPYSTSMYIDETHDGGIDHSTANNINKKYGICINKEFKTYYNILTKTPMSYLDYLNMPAIIESQNEKRQQRVINIQRKGVGAALSKLSKKHVQVNEEQITKINQICPTGEPKIQPIITTRTAPIFNTTEEEALATIKENADMLQALSNTNFSNEVINNIENDNILRSMIAEEEAYLNEEVKNKHNEEIAAAIGETVIDDAYLEDVIRNITIDDAYLEDVIKKHYETQKLSVNKPIEINFMQDLAGHADNIGNMLQTFATGFAGKF